MTRGSLRAAYVLQSRRPVPYRHAGSIVKRCSATRATTVPSSRDAFSRRVAIQSAVLRRPRRCGSTSSAGQRAPAAGRRSAPDREHTEVISESRIDDVVIQHVAQVEQHRPPVPADTVEEMRECPATRSAPALCRVMAIRCCRSRRSRGHVRPPVRERDQEIAALACRGDLVEQPRGRIITHRRVRDAPALPGRAVLGRMVGDCNEPHLRPAAWTAAAERAASSPNPAPAVAMPSA